MNTNMDAYVLWIPLAKQGVVAKEGAGKGERRFQVTQTWVGGGLAVELVPKVGSRGNITGVVFSP